MKILITGANGYLGSHLVRALLKEGHDLAILKRSFSDTGRISDLLQDVGSYDIDTCSLQQIFSDNVFEMIIHTATCYGRSGEPASTIQQANVDFPLRLLEISSTAGVKVFLNTDTSLPSNLNFYSLSKKHFRDWGEMFARRGAIRFINLRLEHFYGAGDDDTKFITHVIKGCLNNIPELPLTAGEPLRDFIHIDDVCAAYLLLLRKAATFDTYFRDYQVGSGQAISIRQAVEMIHKLSGSQTHLDFGALPYRENEVMLSRADNSALSGLGWSCMVDFAEGIRDTIEAERKKNQSKGNIK